LLPKRLTEHRGFKLPHHLGMIDRYARSSSVLEDKLPDGGGSSNTLMKGLTIARLFSDREFYVNVYAETTGSEELPDSVACGGDLRRSS
jgi:hypothetical protein